MKPFKKNYLTAIRLIKAQDLPYYNFQRVIAAML